MSQSFKFKYDEMRENDPAGNNPNTNEGFSDGAFYPSSGSVRNVCFILPDGTMEGLNYAYLVRHACSLEGDSLILEFTTHTVTIKGVHLKELFFQMMQQLNKIVACVDERYNVIQGNNLPVVNHIAISKN